MRVSQISVYHQPKCNPTKLNLNRHCTPPCPENQDDIQTLNFKGKFGAWVGGIVGTAAVVTTAILAAPAAICLAGGGAIIGAIGGHVAEDAVNGEDKAD